MRAAAAVVRASFTAAVNALRAAVRSAEVVAALSAAWKVALAAATDAWKVWLMDEIDVAPAVRVGAPVVALPPVAKTVDVGLPLADATPVTPMPRIMLPDKAVITRRIILMFMLALSSWCQ